MVVLEISLLELMQNYFWIPIVSGLIGMGLQFFLGKLFVAKIKPSWNKFKQRNSNVISISGTWNSFFREEKRMISEKVILKQSGNIIDGSIKMDEREYEFKGEFKNRILVGTYQSKNTRKDERGSIVLKHINEKLLSGYCTFIYDDKQVYNSPYVLTLESEHNPQNGTYKFCDQCKGKSDCCCNSKDVDMPILLPFEVKEISRKERIKVDDFAKKLSVNLYQMKRENDDENKGCIFFKNHKCTIYDNRPIDCRLFPFDFKEYKGEYYLMYYGNICDRMPTDERDIKICAYNLRPLLDLMMPYLSECCDPKFAKRLSNSEPTYLFPISDILDDNNK